MTATLNDTAETQIEQVIDNYLDHVNPGLATLMKFAGFGDVEVEAEGCYLRTMGGVEYLDCLGSYGVFTLGHRHPHVVAAVHRQLDRMPLSSRTFFNEKMGLLAAKLASLSPPGLEYTFFSNSGAESVEAALKMARKTTGRTGFVATIGGYHGKTLGALSVTGRDGYRAPFEPLMPGASFVPYNDIEAARAAVSDQTAAFIVEVIQGEGGIHVATPEYLASLRQICDENGALLIFDEVQTGVGRTGKLFGAEHWGVAPDILTLAKALGGGVMPIGATMGTKAVWEKLFETNPLLHTSTFGGNPLACAAALATLEVLEDGTLLQNATERGNQLLAGLREIQSNNPNALQEVRGLGLMIGVEFTIKDVAELTINLLAARGIVAAYTLNNPKVIRLEPPIIITEAEIDRLLGAFAESVEIAAQMIDEL